uniref:Uncharacterized protein n=1 Tax=Leviviridae sp. TaxID=2027243 RepID=A0A514DB40_9VIRU|nr:MAG: hypothetical protein H2Bulk36332_000004 [Leviviridae sp.]
MSEPLNPGVRKRDLVVQPLKQAHYRRVTNGAVAEDRDIPYQYVGRETTTSRKGSNWLAYQSLKRSAEKRGVRMANAGLLETADLGTGGFTNVKQYIEGKPNMVSFNLFLAPNSSQTYSGPWEAKDQNVGPGSALYPVVPSNLDDLMLLRGATAISRTIPTNPVASAAQFLGELREGIPKIPGLAFAQIKDFRDLLNAGSGEYLNYEFGIKPTLQDLRKFGEAARTSSEVIEQLKRDSGRLIRRRYTFPVERTITAPVTQSTFWYGSPGFTLVGPSPYVGGPGKLTKTREETYEFWFSGAYTYLYQDGDSAVQKMRGAEQRLSKLFGTRINPNLLWELTPWSWAADWVGNTGDVMKNLSALSSDSLVMRWGYIMCKYTCRDTYLLEGVSLKGSTRGPLKQVFVTQVKKRNRATPYGFGLDPAKFTTRQWAILGALGISRGTRML